MRKLFSFGNYAVSYLVRVRLALAAFLSLRPATELGVAPGPIWLWLYSFPRRPGGFARGW